MYDPTRRRRSSLPTYKVKSFLHFCLSLSKSPTFSTTHPITMGSGERNTSNLLPPTCRPSSDTRFLQFLASNPSIQPASAKPRTSSQNSFDVSTIRRTQTYDSGLSIRPSPASRIDRDQKRPVSASTRAAKCPHCPVNLKWPNGLRKHVQVWPNLLYFYILISHLHCHFSVLFFLLTAIDKSFVQRDWRIFMMRELENFIVNAALSKTNLNLYFVIMKILIIIPVLFVTPSLPDCNNTRHIAVSVHHMVPRLHANSNTFTASFLFAWMRYYNFCQARLIMSVLIVSSYAYEWICSICWF